MGVMYSVYLKELTEINKCGSIHCHFHKDESFASYDIPFWTQSDNGIDRFNYYPPVH